jgi:hypothetical protein
VLGEQPLDEHEKRSLASICRKLAA